MPFSTVTKNAMLDAAFVDGDLVALHDEDPGGSGTTGELSGGGYARQAVNWDDASSGAKGLTGTESFSVPAGDVTHFSVWNSAGSVFKGSGALSAPETFAASGTYELTEITLTAS